MNGMKLTETQKKLLTILSDGLPHTRKELHACLPDELSDLSAIQKHLSNLRKLLRGNGEGIICELVNRRICYRHIRFISTAD